MEKSTIEELTALLSEAEVTLDTEEVKADVSLEEQGLDSVDFLKLYLVVEEKYGIKIPDADMPELGTLKAISAYVNERI